MGVKWKVRIEKSTKVIPKCLSITVIIDGRFRNSEQINKWVGLVGIPRLIADFLAVQ